MAHPSKVWLVPLCLFAYMSMGQAGCQTTPANDITYVRSDIVRLRRDVETLNKKIDDASAPDVSLNSVLRNQAAQQDTLLEIRDGQQRTESRIEETRYAISELKKEVENLKLNLIRQMEALRAQGKASPAWVPPADTQPEKQAAPTKAPEAAKPPDKPAAPPPAAQPAEPVQEPPEVKPTQPLDYTKLYDTAYDDYQQQNYSLARTGFAEYLRLFPDTDLADNAQYWIGECYYAEGKYAEAAAAFMEVITKYPTGNKVPRAMLKAGHAELQLGRKDQARQMFQQVIDAYPLSSEADQAKSRLKKLE